MALDEGVYLDARQRGSIARYVNHSCNPNCKVERWKVRGVVRAAVVALREIKPNEELSFDYKWERKRGRAPTKCHCGESNCRGTLELAKSLDEANLEQQLQDQWLRTSLTDASIVNSTVRVFSKEHDEYFLGEVTGYDSDIQQHSILYRHDMNEAWEDLRKEDWMILDANVDRSDFLIAKKSNRKRRQSPTEGLIAAPPSSEEVLSFKNYLYIQSPVHQILQAKHYFEQCERNHVVHIHIQQLCKPPLPPNMKDPDDVAKYKALESSADGTVWKLSISGSGVGEAFVALEKQVLYLDKKFEQDYAAGGSLAASLTNPAISAATAAATLASEQQSRHQIIFPREISDHLKRDLPALRARCRTVNLNIFPSASVSKQFGRLVLDGALESDIASAKETIWNALLVLCVEAQAPLAPNKMPKNLGCYAGELTAAQFRLLSSGNERDKSELAEKNRLRMDACENLRKLCPFFVSFENTQQCTVWVQADYDKGRINSNNQIVSTSNSNSPKHFFIGYSPKEIPRLWTLIQTRVSELSRGVKYLHLGMDRVYQKLMMMNGNKFFDFVMRVASVKLDIDPMTGDHIRIDGRLSPHATVPPELSSKTEPERALLAEEVIMLQIEMYRDHCIREQSWIFGRDWSLVASAVPVVVETNASGSASLGQLDLKSAAQGATDIADTIAMLGLDPSVAAHAAIILYRFVVANTETSIKIRDAVLACIYLANKAQKLHNWKRLDQVVKVGFEAMYKSKFDENQDIEKLSEKVLATEAFILESLDYDIFWRGVDWIRSAAIGAGQLQPRQINEIFEFMFTGPVLGCGHDLWLRYGFEYVFAVASGLLQIESKYLFSALSLIPLKVSRAAELLVESLKLNRSPGKSLKHHHLLEGNKWELERRLPLLKQACIDAMTSSLQQRAYDSTIISAADQRYKLIGQQCQQWYVISGIPTQQMRDFIMPHLARVSAESNCTIFIERGSADGMEDILFAGTWRAIYLADNLLRLALNDTLTLPVVTRGSESQQDNAKIQSKTAPGRIGRKELLIDSKWEGTSLSKICNESVGDRFLGGKSFAAGRVTVGSLRNSGLRWWLSKELSFCPSGSLIDTFVVRSSDGLASLGQFARALESESAKFPMLSSTAFNDTHSQMSYPFAAVSSQEWPSAKVAKIEAAKASKVKGASGLPVAGISAAALQEMQLLTQLHCLITGPLGHPNFLIPFAIAATVKNNSELDAKAPNSIMTHPIDLLNDPMHSLFQTRDESAKKSGCTSSNQPHLLFQPTPFRLQRFLSKKYNRGVEDLRSHSALVASWFHDLLSAVVHCHSNSIILRNFDLDEIAVDQTGTLKFTSLYRSKLLESKSREMIAGKVHAELLKAARAKSKEKGKKSKCDDDDKPSPYTPPEILLGCPLHSRESDIWTVGCILAHLLLNKPLFVGDDRAKLFESMAKLVGTPREDNFELLKKFPHFPKVKKNYKRGVEKGLEHMLKDDASEYEKAIDLLGRMLHLDPTKRCTAAEALGHEYMADYMEKTNTSSFREQYVKQWMTVKTTTLKQAKGLADSSQTKRKPMLMDSRATEDDDDDLYGIDDLMAEQPSKRRRND
ncbi:hypothetical protein MPSEU_000029100 [Mayamaea pseudoterrestris]|nr:hypothetical protein MPSEU_000029100 [Mayamaea pseudoterrestris]